MASTARRRAGTAAASVAVAALSLPAPAGASDASVLRAWQSNDRAFTATGAQVRLATVTFERHHDPTRLLALFARTRTLVDTTRHAVLGQRPSTATGASARSSALSSLGFFGRSILSRRDSTLATAHGRRALGAHLEDRADDLLDLSDATAARAIRLFRSLGLRAGPVGAEE